MDFEIATICAVMVLIVVIGGMRGAYNTGRRDERLSRRLEGR